MHVAGVNPTDWKSRAGNTGGVNFDFQVPGQDGAGVIEAVGHGVAKGWVGERVWVYFAAWQRQWGTAAEYTVVPVCAGRAAGRRVVRAGRVLGIPALTAYHCLFADGPLTARVLVAGGAGAVGHAAIELASGRARSASSPPCRARRRPSWRGPPAPTSSSTTASGTLRPASRAAPDGVDRVVEVALRAEPRAGPGRWARRTIVTYAGTPEDGGGARPRR